MKLLKLILIALVLVISGFKSPGTFTYTKISRHADSKKLVVEIAFYNQHLDELMSRLTGAETVFDMDIRSQRLEFWKYLKENFIMKVNGKPVNFALKGLYPFGDQEVILLHVKDVDKVRSLEVENRILFDLYPHQQNFIEVSAGTEQFSDVTSADKPEVKFYFAPGFSYAQ